MEPAPATPDSGYPLGWGLLLGVSSRVRPAWHSSHVTVAITGSPAQSNPSSAPSPILGASQNRGGSECKEDHGWGCTSVLGAR
jgi:hypothetical protein